MPNPSFFSPRLQERGFTPGTSILGRNTEPPFTLLDILGNQQGPGPALQDLKTMLLEPGGHPGIFPSLQEGMGPQVVPDFMPGGDLAGPMGGLLGQTLFHGASSGKRFSATESNPFGEFLRQFIGGGEGSQAFGVGFYLAEAPRTGRVYANMGGKKIISPALEASEATALPPWIRQELASVEGASEGMKQATLQGIMADLNRLLGEADSLDLPVGVADIERHMGIVEKLSKNPQWQSGEGLLYRVEFPDERIPDLIDHDALLKAQPPQVMRAAREIEKELGIGDIFDITSKWTKEGRLNDDDWRSLENTFEDLLEGSGEDVSSIDDVLEQVWSLAGTPRTGGELYENLSAKYEMANMTDNPKEFIRGLLYDFFNHDVGTFPSSRESQMAISEAFSELGVPGLRFWDNFSRKMPKDQQAKEGTRNYVIFPGSERLLKITGIED